MTFLNIYNEYKYCRCNRNLMYNASPKLQSLF